jgi:hypothetical protein
MLGMVCKMRQVLEEGNLDAACSAQISTGLLEAIVLAGRCGGAANAILRIPRSSFHVRRLDEEEDGKGRDPMRDLERLARAWGKRNRSPSDSVMGGNDDHAMVLLDCDLCIFRKLRKASPDVGQPDDCLLLVSIRLINLDAFWIWTSPTEGSWEQG